MKKNILYVCMACLALSFTACSDDPNDAVEKHVYTESEAPYLRIDASANITYNAEFREGHIAPISISLKNYAEKIQEKLGMTVDDMLAAVDNGSVVFYNINTAKTVWDKTAPTVGTSGWGYDVDGNFAKDKDGNYDASKVVASVELDKANKAIVVKVPETTKAGLSIIENVGFAINNGRDYDDYVRFNIPISVTNPGLVIAAIDVATAEYDPTSIDLSKSKDAIEKCMGISYSEFLKDLKDPEGPIAMYMVDNETGKWDVTSEYTATGIGYWVDGKSHVCVWNADGFSFYIEADGTAGSIGIGHAPGIASKTKQELNFVFAMKDDPQNKFIQFKVTATVL